MVSLTQSHDEENTSSPMETEPYPPDLLETLVTEVNELLDRASVPLCAMDAMESCLAKMPRYSPGTDDYNDLVKHLDWLLKLPWGNSSVDNGALKVRDILKGKLVGLDIVKEQIVGLIALGEMRTGISKGKIICLCGPPATGKTKIGVSIASSLNRTYFQVFLSKAIDVDTMFKGSLKGEPGVMVQGLMKVQTFNPVVIVECIDELADCLNGARVLSDLLDSNLNADFVDNYLGVPIDLSKVLFVCTAYNENMIPEILRPKLKVISIGSYVTDEKLAIARMLEQSIREKYSITEGQVELIEDALRHVIDYYCLDFGVQGVQTQLDNIYEKVPLKILEMKADSQSGKLVIDMENLSKFIGNPLYHDRCVGGKTKVGIAMGLSCIQMRGALSRIEAVKAYISANIGVYFIGFIGNDMKISFESAYTFATSYAVEQLQNFFIESSRIHVSISPATEEKDGPSAGVAIVTALLSLAMGRCVNEYLAMTGEITLTGAIERVGGIKEKTVAARRCKIKTLILPLDNKADYEALPIALTNGLNVHFVKEYSQVFKLAFT